MKLSCHCGSVRLTVSEAPETLTSCNCSICRRYASLWGYFSPEDVHIEVRDAELSSYQWAEEYLEFNFCSHCGCLTHYLTTEKVPTPKIGVNFRMAESQTLESIPVRKFDGADTWKYLDKRPTKI